MNKKKFVYIIILNVSLLDNNKKIIKFLNFYIKYYININLL